jgi:very-short-patch-repair endonuclease
VGTSRTATVTDLAARQHGVVTVAQLAELGVRRRWVDNLVRRGVLRRVGSGVYVIAGSEPTPRQQLTAGLFALGEESWVSHEAAAALHGLDRHKAGAVEFTVLRAGRGRKVPYTVHTTRSLGPLDRVTVDGLRCLSATRTIIDLAHARIPAVRLEAMIDSAVRLGLTAPLVLQKRLGELRGPGRWGARLLDRLLLDSGGHTLLERRFLTLVREQGLPAPRTQVIHRRDGNTVARVDFLFDAVGVVVEVTGSKGHSSSRERAHDAQRRNELQDIGRKVYEYTWDDVTGRPAYVRTTLTRRLRRAGWPC